MSKSINYNGLNLTVGKGSQISEDATIGFKEHGKGKIIIGNNVTIDSGVVLRTYGGTITIDNNVYIGIDTIIYGGGNVQIKENTLISPRVQIYAQNHGICINSTIRSQKNDMYGVWIGNDCWIGAGSIITDGVQICKGCVLGAGSVLTKNMMIAYEVWAGNPAKFIKKRPVCESFLNKSTPFPKVDTCKSDVNLTPVVCPDKPYSLPYACGGYYDYILENFDIEEWEVS